MSWPLFETGFRPFFLGAALWLAFATPYWVWLLVAGGGASRLDPLAWHQHEMLFGGMGAIVAGFLLTAVPNWTGRPPLRNAPLLLLFLLWVAARVANLTSAFVPPWFAPLLDAGFLGALTFLALHEVRAAGNRRNLPVVGLVGCFAVAGLLSQLASLGLPVDGDLARRLGITCLVLLVALIGGRIVPNFTTNWLKSRGATRLPAPFGPFDKASLAVLALALIAWTIAPHGLVTAGLALAAGVAQLARLLRWHGHRTLGEPLVAVLHVGYLWLAFALLVVAAGILAPGFAGLSGTHAFTAGLFGTMTLAVMTRASLGHTGRPLTADRLTVAIYVLVCVGALVRVIGDAIGLPPLASRLMATTTWSGAYLLFALHYGPMLVRPRVDLPSPSTVPASATPHP